METKEARIKDTPVMRSRTAPRAPDGNDRTAIAKPGDAPRKRLKPGRPRVSTTLRLYHAALGLDELHYGLWNGDPLTIEGLRTAQQRYSEALLDWIPQGVRTVLDAGCGTGSNCIRLLKRGYRPEGLAPDPYLEGEFRKRLDVPFHLSRLQDLFCERTFDLILMSESCQYVRLSSLVPAVQRLAPGGHLLVSDVFRLARHENEHGGHELDTFMAEVKRGGLELLRREDVTEQAAVTLDYARLLVKRHVDPGLAAVSEKLRSDHPYLFWIARRMLRRSLARAERVRGQLDGQVFRRHHRYLLMLFRVPAA